MICLCAKLLWPNLVWLADTPQIWHFERNLAGVAHVSNLSGGGEAGEGNPKTYQSWIRKEKKAQRRQHMKNAGHDQESIIPAPTPAP